MSPQLEHRAETGEPGAKPALRRGPNHLVGGAPKTGDLALEKLDLRLKLGQGLSNSLGTFTLGDERNVVRLTLPLRPSDRRSSQTKSGRDLGVQTLRLLLHALKHV